MYKYISFDPGETTGIACWNENAKCVRTEMYKEDLLDGFLIDLEHYEKLDNIKVFIVEKYRIFGHKRDAHVGSEVETIQVSGQLKAFARRYKIEVVEQPARILPIAQKWSGVKVPSNHSVSHWASAFNHGYYYLHKLGLIEARVLKK